MQESDYKQIRLKFQENYFKNIKPKLNVFEQERLKNKKLVKKYTTLILSIGFTIVAIISVCGLVDFAIFLAISTAAFSFFPASIYEKKLEINIKKELMPLICGCFDNLAWLENYRGDLNIFERIKLIGSYNRESTDDYFRGIYNEIPFEIIEACFKRVSGSGKNRSTKTIFDGIIIRIQAVKKFSSHTIIRPNGANLAFSGLKKTELEDVVFEEKYDVFTNDEIEARYLITPAFMDKFNDIKKLFKAFKISAAFYGEYFYLALDTRKDMFKIKNLDKEIKDASLFIDMFEEIMGIYKLIDYLKLTYK